MENFYVYLCFVDNVIRYVGKGTKDRFKHCNSGKSTCALLNRDYFEGKQIDTIFYKQNMTESDALELEKSLIQEYKHTIYNVSNNEARKVDTDSNTESSTVSERNSLKVDMGLLRMKSCLKDEDGNDTNLTLNDKVVYALMYARYVFFKSSGKQYYDTNKQIADMLGLDEKTVGRSIGKLSKTGLISKRLIKVRNLPKNVYDYVKNPSQMVAENLKLDF